MGALRKQWQVPPRFLRSALRHRSQATGPVPIPATKSRPPIWRQNRIPQYEPERRTAIVLPNGMFAFMDNMVTELRFTPFLPLSVLAAPLKHIQAKNAALSA